MKKKMTIEELEEAKQELLMEQAKAAAMQAQNKAPDAVIYKGDYINDAMPRLKRIRHQFLKRFKTKDIVFINMELLNGNHLTLIIPVKIESFKFRKASYIVDESLKYYNISLREWCLDYHENLSLPIQRKIPVTSIRKGAEISDTIDDVIYCLNPHSLHEYMTNNVIRAVIQASSIQGIIKIMMAFVIITGLISTGHLLWALYKAGVFKGLGI